MTKTVESAKTCFFRLAYLYEKAFVGSSRLSLFCTLIRINRFGLLLVSSQASKTITTRPAWAGFKTAEEGIAIIMSYIL